MQLGFRTGGDIVMSATRSLSPMLPQSSLAKAAESREAPPNLPPPPPLPKHFVPKRVVLEQPVASSNGKLESSFELAFSLLLHPVSQWASRPGATPRSSVQGTHLPTLGFEEENT
jgi:hypothetical protein